MTYSLHNSEILRNNMVIGQILPHCVLPPHVHNAFSHVIRENFLPQKLWHNAYCDKYIELNSNRVMFPPLAQAYILNFLPRYVKKIAVLGGGYGYLSALLSNAFPKSSIVVIEPDPQGYRKLRKNMEGITNVSLRNKDLNQPFDIEESFDCIVYDGGSIINPLQDHFHYLMPKGNIIFVGGKYAPEICYVNVIDKNRKTLEISNINFYIPTVHHFIDEEPFSF